MMKDENLKSWILFHEENKSLLLKDKKAIVKQNYIISIMKNENLDFIT